MEGGRGVNGEAWQSHVRDFSACLPGRREERHAVEQEEIEEKEADIREEKDQSRLHSPDRSMDWAMVMIPGRLAHLNPLRFCHFSSSLLTSACGAHAYLDKSYR